MRNNFENDVYLQLKKSGSKFKYESEKIPYTLYRNYIPDFIIETPKGKVYVECKGYFRPEHKAKMAAVKKQHPDLDIRLVFYINNKSRNPYNKTLRDSIRWATKNGFVYSIGVIPDEWLNGNV